jgi:hypothetical protein
MNSCWPRGSYAALLDELDECPEAVSVMFDSELALLLRNPPPDQTIGEKVLGEALLRRWLYGNRCPDELMVPVRESCGPALWQIFESRMLRVRTTLNLPEKLSCDKATGLTVSERNSWRWLEERAGDYCDAHGMIAVARPDGKNEAIALPFLVFQGELRPGYVQDKHGNNIGQWTEEFCRIAHCFEQPPKVVVDVLCGIRRDLLEGGSFALPILVAFAQRADPVLNLSPLDLLCTGGLDATGALAAVGSLEAKRGLAHRLNVRVFIYPGVPTEDSGNDLALPPGTSARDCLRTMEHAFADRGIGQMNEAHALNRVKALKRDVHTGAVPLEKAEPRLARCEQVFTASKTPSSEFVQEGQFYAYLLRGSMANHSGNPIEGKACGEKARALAVSGNLDPMALAHAMAAAVVSLTDLGLLEEAEADGRSLLRHAETMPGEVQVKLRARMTASGALGGQPLLHLALINPKHKDESLELLNKAVDCARELNDKNELARDIAQRVLWHALFQPAQAIGEIEQSHGELKQLGEEGSRSEPYLVSCRWLAAYRLLLRGASAVESFASWPLPLNPPWLMAICLKYRGSLRAAAGEPVLALEDFSASFDALENQASVLMRFMAATSALQAAQSLREIRPKPSREFARKAKSLFLAVQPSLYGLLRDADWFHRAEILTNGTDPQGTANPQLKYRY